MPVASDKVKIFLSVSKLKIVAVTLVESIAVPVTVSPTSRDPDTPDINNFVFKVKVGGLGDC